MIKVIIFDLGGVILQHRSALISYILKKMFPHSVEEATQVYSENSIALNKGVISSKDVLLQLKKQTNTSKDIEELSQLWEDLYSQESKSINIELLEIIDKLKKNYKVYLFTDTIDVHDAINSKRGIYEKFDGIYKSFEEKVSKKEGKKAFKHVLAKIGTSPEECIFIDDVELNIDGAKRIGIKTILYKNNNQLKQDFKKLGIL